MVYRPFVCLSTYSCVFIAIVVKTPIYQRLQGVTYATYIFRICPNSLYSIFTCYLLLFSIYIYIYVSNVSNESSLTLPTVQVTYALFFIRKFT